MTIGQIMTRQIISVTMDQTVQDVRELFETYRFHHLLVIEKHKLVGVISDRDLLKNLSPFVGKALLERTQDLATLQRRVHQIMTRQPITGTVDMTIPQAAQLMLEQDISCLPVADQELHPVGIVTWKDLLRSLTGLARV